MGHFAGHAVHELVHLDSKLFTTLRLLITQPGALTVEYFAGRKSRYIAPLRLFLILFAFFFVAYTAYKPLAAFSIRTAAKHDAKAVGTLLDMVAKKKHMTREEVAERIDERWQHWISLLQLSNIIAIGLVLGLVMVGSERKLAEHFVFAAHYLSFSYVVSLAIWPIRYFTGIGPGIASKTIGITTSIALFIYLYLAMKRYYGAGFFSALFAFAGIWIAGMLLMLGPFVGAILFTAFG
ncbi:MAG: hypothetical protein JWO97_614 [Acidobacteria bacterium]|nr:hypothetical protein [Acidobacteriota bacterium]